MEHLEIGSAACVFYARHTSHADAAILWAALPTSMRVRTRPVAALDYWSATRWRRFVSAQIFRALLLDRRDARLGSHPLAQMRTALDHGQSLILFPEGSRQVSGTDLAAFKPGLYWLARARPDLRLIPVGLQGVQHILPKGSYLPVPFECSVRFAPALQLRNGESCEAFLARAQAALEQLNLPQ